MLRNMMVFHQFAGWKPLYVWQVIHTSKKGPIGASKCRNPVTVLCTGLPYIGNLAMLKVDCLLTPTFNFKLKEEMHTDPWCSAWSLVLIVS